MLIAHGRVCVLCLGVLFVFVCVCECVWYLTKTIIDKSPEYGCHYSLAPMVICGIVAPLYFCLLLGTKKKIVLVVPWSESSCDSTSEENPFKA